MLEHMKNYKLLMSKISSWLRPKGNSSQDDALFFVHIFCHKFMPYDFVEGDGWMAQNFFSGMFETTYGSYVYLPIDMIKAELCLHMTFWYVNHS